MIGSRKLWRTARDLRFVESVVRMSFPKAPLKRFNDPSGAYGERSWGNGKCHDLAPLGSLHQRLIGDIRARMGLLQLISFFWNLYETFITCLALFRVRSLQR